MGTLTVVIVTYNSEADIRACLESLRVEVAAIPHEVFVVDNASRDATVRVVREEFRWVRLLANDHNAGFPGANNQALREGRGDLVLLLNPDTVVHPGSIQALCSALEANPALGLVGPRLVDGDGVEAPDLRFPTLARSAARILLGGRAEDGRLPPDRAEVLSGAALMVRRSVLDAVGLLDEQMFWREDADLCWRAHRAGFGIRVVEEARITHLVGRSAASNLAVALEKPISSEIAFFMKHRGPGAAAVETVLMGALGTLRLAKWEALRILRPTPQADERVTAFRAILARLPRFYREARQRYGR